MLRQSPAQVRNGVLARYEVAAVHQGPALAFIPEDDLRDLIGRQVSDAEVSRGGFAACPIITAQ